jgi:hypothetical protein
MFKKSLSIYSKISNKLSWTYRYLIRSREKTIYHCCIQKTASQWFRKVLNDQSIWQSNKLLLYSPSENFITEDETVIKKLKNLPNDILISPLYIRFSNFYSMEKPDAYKAFFIARDPRDLLISNYFSLKYSHTPYHPYILEMRKKLNSMSLNDGITKIINLSTKGTKQTLEGWFNQKLDKIILIKYEDLFGDKQNSIFSNLLKHCDINLSDSKIESILQKYSFKNISGRKQGCEDVKHHYRKGIAGDWKNYFIDEHKDLFKKLSGDLLVKCGYEKDNNW